MADQKNRGGQKKGKQSQGQQSGQAEQKLGTATGGAGERSDHDKRADQMSNPDDEARQPTNEKR